MTARSFTDVLAKCVDLITSKGTGSCELSFSCSTFGKNIRFQISMCFGDASYSSRTEISYLQGFAQIHQPAIIILSQTFDWWREYAGDAQLERAFPAPYCVSIIEYILCPPRQALDTKCRFATVSSIISDPPEIGMQIIPVCPHLVCPIATTGNNALGVDLLQ